MYFPQLSLELKRLTLILKFSLALFSKNYSQNLYSCFIFTCLPQAIVVVLLSILCRPFFLTFPLNVDFAFQTPLLILSILPGCCL